MKWAEAKTRLSLVTATLKFLWAGTPAPFEQDQVDRRAGQVGGGAGIQRVGLVPQLAVEERQVRLDHGVAPGEAVGERGPEGGGAQLERAAEVARVFAGDRVALDGQSHHVAQRRAGRAGHVLVRRPAQSPRSGQADRGIGVARVRAARASGASSRTRPRFVLDGAQRAVASTAARMVAPSDRSAAAVSAGPMAAALARKSS